MKRALVATLCLAISIAVANGAEFDDYTITPESTDVYVWGTGSQADKNDGQPTWEWAYVFIAAPSQQTVEGIAAAKDGNSFSGTIEDATDPYFAIEFEGTTTGDVWVDNYYLGSGAYLASSDAQTRLSSDRDEDCDFNEQDTASISGTSTSGTTSDNVVCFVEYDSNPGSALGYQPKEAAEGVVSFYYFLRSQAYVGTSRPEMDVFSEGESGDVSCTVYAYDYVDEQYTLIGFVVLE